MKTVHLNGYIQVEKYPFIENSESHCNEEIVKLREADCFGNLCDSCNQTIEDTYYIPVLNWGMCKKCFDEWKETAIFYKEDTDFEELNISMTNTTFH